MAIASLAQEGVRVLAYTNPYLIEGSTMFQEAADLGYLMTDADGNAFRQDFGGFLAGTVDLLSTDAFNWYKGVCVCCFFLRVYWKTLHPQPHFLPFSFLPPQARSRGI